YPPLRLKLACEHDQIDIDVIRLVKKEFSQHIGNIYSFQWATTRQNALLALDDFISNNLTHFGDYQDAMVYGSDFMFH
ncbi:cryptochrome/photolyase family protein, partial [Acinetobacter baumannii]